MPPRKQVGAAQRVGYPARAPSASAMCRHASRCGVERGRCRTTRRTERTTWNDFAKPAGREGRCESTSSLGRRDLTHGLQGGPPPTATGGFRAVRPRESQVRTRRRLGVSPK